MITDHNFYYFAVPAVLLTGVSKGGFGGALGGVAVPLMALAISPVQAAAVMLPVLVLMDIFGVRVYLGKWDTANLKIIMPGSMIGIALGTLTFGWIGDFSIRIMLGGDINTVRPKHMARRGVAAAAMRTLHSKRMSFPLFFVFQPNGIMPPISAHAEC